MKPGHPKLIKNYLKSLVIGMNNAFAPIRIKGEEQVYTYTIVFNTKEGAI